MTSNVKIVAILTAKPGHEAELEKLIRGMIAPSRAEIGNKRYDLWQANGQPASFVLDELYADDDAITAHRATPHFQNYLSRIGDLASRTAVVVRALDVGEH